MLSIIPINPIPNQTFSCKIPIDNKNITLTFLVTYNEIAKYWVISISSNDAMLIRNLPIMPAQNLLEQFIYMQIGSAYIVPKHTVNEQYPTYETLNTDWYLVWSDTNG